MAKIQTNLVLAVCIYSFFTLCYYSAEASDASLVRYGQREQTEREQSETLQCLIKNIEAKQKEKDEISKTLSTVQAMNELDEKKLTIKKEELKQEMEQLNIEIETKMEQLGQVETKMEQLGQEIETMGKRIDAKKKEEDNISEELNRIKGIHVSEEEKLKKDREELSQEIEQMIETVNTLEVQIEKKDRKTVNTLEDRKKMQIEMQIERDRALQLLNELQEFQPHLQTLTELKNIENQIIHLSREIQNQKHSVHEFQLNQKISDQELVLRVHGAEINNAVDVYQINKGIYEHEVNTATYETEINETLHKTIKNNKTKLGVIEKKWEKVYEKQNQRDRKYEEYEETIIAMDKITQPRSKVSKVKEIAQALNQKTINQKLKQLETEMQQLSREIRQQLQECRMLDVPDEEGVASFKW